MRKLGVFVLGASLVFAFSICPQSIAYIGKAEESQVYVGGMPAGFTLKTGSAQVIGTCEVVSEKGGGSPAAAVGLRAGDYITKVEGIKVETVAELNEIVNKSKGKELLFEIERGDECFSCYICPLKDKITERYKIGVLVRDSVSGVGTITYINAKTKRFGALGHSVVGDNKKEMHISNGAVYECGIVGINKGCRGRAGELKGVFFHDKPMGMAEKICDCGIYGVYEGALQSQAWVKMLADSMDVRPGNAYIYSTITGSCPKRYNIEIVKVDKGNKENKNYVIKIVDDDLIEETGGIVQGMSGSPIIQEGKLVGAVTHVFLNDPTRGYGIDIEKMMCE